MASYLCNIAKVSHSGYYNYFSIKSVKSREIRDLNDEKSKELILKAFKFKNRKKGAKQIKMVLENHFDTVYNLKKIRRIMKKYNIICTIRKANPYKKISKATKEHFVVKNILNRQFKQEIPRKILLTDITYLNYANNKRAYLSTIKDSSTNEILAYNLSKNISLEIVLNTIGRLLENKQIKLRADSFIHSDQGVHYTSPTFQKLLEANKIGKSMSRKGNCWDNAPIESFFGHFKDETRLKECQTFNELSKEVIDYMKYYNNFRYQWELKKMTPVQYRNHLLKNIT